MGTKKLTDFPDFVGFKLLMQAQKRGLEITGDALFPDTASIMLIGLASLLAEHNIGGINDIIAPLAVP